MAFPFDIPIPPNPQVRIIEELIAVNESLEILIKMFAKAFPGSLSEELTQQIEETKAKRRKIGFQSDEENG